MKSLSSRTYKIIIALFFIIIGRFIPAPAGLSQSAMQVLGVFAGILVLWLTLAIDWPSLLCLAALAFVPEINFNNLLAGSVGGSTFSFLLFTFMCTYAISKTPFIRRVALAFVNSKLALRGPWSFAVLFFTSALVLGLVMSPTVLFVIFLPLHNEICEVLGLEKSDRFANMLMIGMMLSIGLSSGMTPIAHVFSIMAMGFYNAATGLTINYFHYIIFGSAVGIICFVLMIAFFRLFFRPDTSVFKVSGKALIENDVDRMDKREKIILLIFGIVIFIWVAPGLLNFVLPEIAAYIDSFGTALPPLLGAVALMMITIDGKPLLEFKETMSKGIGWGAIIMTASTLALGSAMTNPDIGLTTWLQSTMGDVISGYSPMILILIFTLWSAVQTNLSSNMVTITVVSAVALPIAIASGGAISTPAIASIIGLMGAFAFTTPPAHPNVALSIGSGWTTTKDVAIYGGLLMLTSVVVTVVIGYPIAVALMGY